MFGLVCRAIFIFSLFTWLNHLISCGMVGIGFCATADTGMSWMDTRIQSGRASCAIQRLAKGERTFLDMYLPVKEEAPQGGRVST